MEVPFLIISSLASQGRMDELTDKSLRRVVNHVSQDTFRVHDCAPYLPKGEVKYPAEHRYSAFLSQQRVADKDYGVWWQVWDEPSRWSPTLRHAYVDMLYVYLIDTRQPNVTDITMWPPDNDDG